MREQLAKGGACERFVAPVTQGCFRSVDRVEAREAGNRGRRGRGDGAASGDFVREACGEGRARAERSEHDGGGGSDARDEIRDAGGLEIDSGIACAGKRAVGAGGVDVTGGEAKTRV